MCQSYRNFGALGKTTIATCIGGDVRLLRLLALDRLRAESVANAVIRLLPKI
jgi:hypothetical protein